MDDLDNFRELEYKYNADGVNLLDFVTLMKGLNPAKKKDVSSWDTYYTKENTEDEFQRFRDSDSPELTKKKKLKTTNNWERIESDLPLDPARATEDKVSFHVGMEGYKKNFKIYKTCFIYWYELVNTVYYIVYDENMKEQGRFIEIEVNKEKVKEIGIDQCLKVLKEYEQTLSALGISPQNRLKKSLFEMFKR